MTCVIPASENDDPMAELIISDDYKKLLLAAAGQLLRTMGHSMERGFRWWKRPGKGGSTPW
jgi:hypothetical protein